MAMSVSPLIIFLEQCDWAGVLLIGRAEYAKAGLPVLFMLCVTLAADYLHIPAGDKVSSAENIANKMIDKSVYSLYSKNGSANRMFSQMQNRQILNSCLLF